MKMTCEMGGCERDATHAVGVWPDRELVCEPCLDWGDTRRWWNSSPRVPLPGLPAPQPTYVLAA